MSSKESTSQEEIAEKTEARQKATDLLAQGKRNMVCGEIPKAVSLFEEAVKILVDKCGELSYDCAEAYFNCGSALLELGRMENNVLGAALEGVDVEEEKEEPTSEQFEKPPEEDGDDGSEGDQEGDEETAEDVEESEATAEESQEGDENEKGGDDVGNFQLAWEHLDLAKVIYLKNDSKEDQLKAAECHLKLGEVSMETELHEQAAEDLLAALRIQEKHLPADDRIIAETHYTLGLAFGLGKDFENSITHYQRAVSVIEARIDSLSKLVEEKEVDAENKENQKEDPLQKYKDEIKDLRELIPEMQNKIEDAKIEKKDMSKMVEMAKAALGLGSASTTTGFSASAPKAESSSNSSSQAVDENGEKKASDIAHLVRRKRKQEEEVEQPSEVDTKKLCKDETAEEVKGKDKKEDECNGHVEKSEENAAAPEPMTS